MELTRKVLIEEMRKDAIAKLKRNPNDNLSYLEFIRDSAAADREEAFQKGDMLKANSFDEISTKVSYAANELKHLRERMVSAEKLLVSRLIVALGEKT